VTGAIFGEVPMSDSRTVLPTASRWLQLAIGIVCMVMIANLQYGWTLFVTPIADGMMASLLRSRCK
jgi:OFA family oxalate/formate antiporter-like MFS transporter